MNTPAPLEIPHDGHPNPTDALAAEYASTPTAVERPLHLLLVLDSPDDATAMLHLLRRGGLDPTWERVGTADGLRTALAAGPWDAVLSAYALLGFGAAAALDLVRASDPDLPFIVVAGTVGENAAVALMRATASDYILKHELVQLPPAVEREVREAGNRRAKRAAERAAAHLAAVVESSDDAIISKTLDGVITTWNPAAERLYGWSAAEAVGRHVSFLIPPDKVEELAGQMRQLVAGEPVGYFETVRMHRDGRRIDVALTISRVRNAAGHLIGVSKTARDIQERKRAEEALRRSEERYRGLIEAIPALVWVSEATGVPVLHNRIWYEYTGTTPADADDDRWHQAIHPDDAAGAAALWERCKASGEPYSCEYRLWRADGEYRWFLSQKTVHTEPGGTKQWIGICTDIDDRKRAEEVLRQNTSLLRAITDGTPDVVFVKDRAGRYLLLNPAAVRLVGRPVEELLGQDDTILFGPADAGRIMDQDRRLMELGQTETLEEEELTFEGVTRTLLSSKTPYRDAVGNVIGIARDITERRRAEDAVRASEERYRTLVAATAAIVWDCPASGEFDSPQPGWTAFTGQSLAQHSGWGWLDVVHPDDRDTSARVWAAAVREQGAGQLEHRLRRADGEYRHMFVRAVPILDPGGAIREWVGTHTDVTDQKRAEEALRDREELLQTIITHIPCGVFWKDRDSVLLGCNNQFAEDFGATTPKALYGQTEDERATPAEAAVFIGRDRQVIETGEPLLRIEEPHSLADGRTKTLLTSKVPLRGSDGGVIGVLGVYLDITELKQAEAERAELFDRLNFQIERMPLAYLLTDADWRYTRWNQAAERMFGFTQAEVLGKHPFEVIVPPPAQALVADFFARMAAGDMDAHGESDNVTKGGRTITCAWYNTPLFGPDGTFQGVFSLAQDVTARRQVDQSLQLRDRAIRAATQGLLITDPSQPDHPIIYVSPGFERITGYAATEVLGRNCRFLQGKDTDPVTVARLRAAIRGEEACTVELLNYRKDGTPFWNELSIAPVRDAAGRLANFVGVQTDVTARRNLEEQFRQAQKMEAFGQLAGGVAHDFNNLLTIINGYSDLLLDRLPSTDPSRELVTEILKAGERSAGLTRQLLAFSRQQVLAPRVLDLNAVVADTDKMLLRLLGEDLRLATALAPDLWAVRADAGQVEQVLMNLAVNARDAMPTGGKLTIETRNVELDEGYARTHPGARPGEHVLLSVTDSGSGMPPEVKARIFEPFFTTKAPGKGTGLGLATVFGIVKQSGGHVAVYSEVGVGTSFKVYLPRVESAAGGSKIRPGLLLPPRGAETVLLVEDEEGVRTLTSRVLTGCGYTVLEAADGAEAVRVAAGHGGPIHLLVTDVVLPGTGGRAVAEQITARHPRVRVLFMSGYTDDAVVRHGVLQEGVNFLQKPFSPVALAFKVREVLDASSVPNTHLGGTNV